MNVIIYSDLQKTYNEHFDVLVKSVSDYVPSYATILEAVYTNRRLIVVVQNKYCLSNFSKMQTRYPDDIQVKANSPKLKITELTGVHIPDYITEQDIVSVKLIEKANEVFAHKGMDFENNVLSFYLNSYFAFEKFPSSQIVDLIRNTNLNFLTIVEQNILLKKVYSRKIKKWEEQVKDSSELLILSQFISNPGELLSKLAAYLMLKGYPVSLMDDVVGETAAAFRKLKISDNVFLPEGMETLNLQRNIKIWLSKRTADDLGRDELLHEIEMLSGLFIEELNHVYSLLENNRKEVDPLVIDKIRSKFIRGAELDIAFEEKLNSMIPPKEPVCPIDLNSLDEWLRWAESSYLPYRFWLESNDIWDNKMDEYAERYGDWIFQNYSSLISSESRMLHKTLINLSSSLQTDEISLIVIIDNFNYKYVPVCKSYLFEKGFGITIDQQMISMIPTETSVSKMAFFSGQAFNTEVKSYDKLCKEWESLLGGKINYLSDIGKLDMIHELDAKLYILNYLSIDKILHESQDDSALPISYRIKQELRAMMDKVVAFSKRTGSESKIKLYFISDHGSTKISKMQHNLIDSKYYKSKSEECAYRVLPLEDKKFDTYKNSIGHLCYVLDRHDYGIKENYLIAKGYNRFIETDFSFYVHGGITPEENIIPLLKFERVNTTFIEPEILMRTKELRYSTNSTINLTINNHNEYAIDHIEILLLNPNVRWDMGSLSIPRVEGVSQFNFELDKVRISKSQDFDERISLKIRFGYFGKAYERTYDYPIKMKAIQENKVDLNDLF